MLKITHVFSLHAGNLAVPFVETAASVLFGAMSGVKLPPVAESKCPCWVLLRSDPWRQQFLPPRLSTNPLMKLKGNNYNPYFSFPYALRQQISFSLEWHSIVGRFHSIKQSHLMVKMLGNRRRLIYWLNSPQMLPDVAEAYSISIFVLANWRT